MTPTVSPPSPGIGRYSRPLAFATLLLLCLFNAGFFAQPTEFGGADFGAFYVAGRIVARGDATHLYEVSTQISTAAQFFRPDPTDFPVLFYHPPYEAALLSPLSFVAPRTAYRIWTAFNLAAVVLASQLLLPFGAQRLDRILGALLFSAAFPIAVGLWQGQDSGLLLALMAAVVVCLARGHESVAGALLALSLFKFQYAVPIALILLLQRRWRFVLTFSGVGSLLGIVSVAMVGRRGAADYLGMLLSTGHEEARRMPNLRGLLETLFGARIPEAALLAAILALSGLLILWCGLRFSARSDSGSREELNLALVIVVALVVSVHLHIQDLALLLVPISVIFRRGMNSPRGREKEWAGLFVLCGLFFVTPVYLILVHRDAIYLLVVLIILLAFAIAKEMLRARMEPNAA